MHMIVHGASPGSIPVTLQKYTTCNGYSPELVVLTLVVTYTTGPTAAGCGRTCQEKPGATKGVPRSTKPLQKYVQWTLTYPNPTGPAYVRICETAGYVKQQLSNVLRRENVRVQCKQSCLTPWRLQKRQSQPLLP